MSLYFTENSKGFSGIGCGGRDQIGFIGPSLPDAVRKDGRDGEKIPLRWTRKENRKVTLPDAEEYRFVYTEDSRGLEFCSVCRISRKEDSPMEWTGTVVNTGETDCWIDPGTVFDAEIPVMDRPTAVQIKKESGYAEGLTLRNQGDPGSRFYTEGTGIYRTAMTSGTVLESWVNTLQGFNSSGYFPMIYLLHEGYGEYVALGWSSGRVTASCNGQTVRMSADIGIWNCPVKESLNGDFVTRIPAGASLKLPPVYAGCFEGDLDDGANAFKKWFFAEKAPAVLREDEREPLIQIDAQYTPERAAEIGIESIKWDNGWWADVSNGIWTAYEGAWSHIENNRYGDPGFGPKRHAEMLEYGKQMKQYGLNWATYNLLHDTTDGDHVAVDVGEFNSVRHPDWFSGHKICWVSGENADLGNTECVEWLKKAMPEFFKTYGIRTWRSDFEPITVDSDKENRHGAGTTDVQYWCTVGFEELVDELYRTVPGFRYESCSSGGSMKDLFTASKAVVINCDDLANYLSLRTTFYDGSYVIHPTQLQMPVNPDDFCMDCPKFRFPEYEEKDTEAVKHMGMRTLMLGGIMLGSWSGGIDGHLRFGLDEYYQKYFALYRKKVRPLIRHGEQYHILPRPDGIHWDGMQYTDLASGSSLKSVIFAFKPSEEAGTECLLYPRGLDGDRRYRITFEDGTSEEAVRTGREIMKSGLTVRIEGVGSELIWLSEEAGS